MAIANVTWDAVNKYSTTILSNNNLTASTSSTLGGVRSSHGKIKGKWYCELTSPSSGTFTIGIIDGSFDMTNPTSITLGTNQKVRAYSPYAKLKYPESIAYGITSTANDVYSILLDLDNGKLEFYRNGVSMGVSHTDLSNLLKPIYIISGNASGWAATTVTANFGATPFQYALPSGFSPYNQEFVNKILISLGDGEYGSVAKGSFTDSVVPKMTSSSMNGYTISASSESAPYNAWKAFDGTNATDKSWVTASVATAWIKVDLGVETSKKIEKYSIQTHNAYIANNINASPKSWTLEGSNDNFVTFDILDTKSNITNWVLDEVKSYEIVNNNSYRFYRVNFTSAVGGTQYMIGEIGLMEKIKSKLKISSNASETYFIKHGMDKPIELDMSTVVSTRAFIEQSPTTLGSGKVFTKTIDTSQVPIKKVTIE